MIYSSIKNMALCLLLAMSLCLSAPLSVALFPFTASAAESREDAKVLHEFIERLTGSDLQAAKEAENTVEQWLKATKPYPVQTSWKLTEYQPYYDKRKPLMQVTADVIRIFCQQNNTQYTERAFTLYKNASKWLGDGPMERGMRVELARGFFQAQQRVDWVVAKIWPTLALPEELFLPQSVLGGKPSYYYDEENGPSFYDQQNSHFVYLKITRMVVEKLLSNGKVDQAKAIIDGMKDWRGTHALKMRDFLSQLVKDAEKQ